MMMMMTGTESWPRVRLSAAEETALAQSIRDAEQKTYEAVRGLVEADEVLAQRGSRVEQTRAKEVERLGQAVVALEGAAARDPTLRARARAARVAWSEVEALQWRLAMSAHDIVRPLAKTIAGVHFDAEDLAHEGLIGLMRAARRFEPERDIRFRTYAKWWARAQMTRAVDGGGRMIRLPGGAVHWRRQLVRLRASLEAEGVMVTDAVLARASGLAEDRVKSLLADLSVMSLDAPAGGEESRSALVDMLPDRELPGADTDLIRSELVARCMAGLQALENERLRYIVVRRFGLDGEEARTLRQLGEELGISRERVRQLEKAALKKIRQSAFD